MIKEAYGVGDTYEQAQQAAKAELNVGSDAEIQYEIIDMPRKKVFGMFGGSKAKVRAYVELPDEVPAKKPEKPEAPIKPAKPERAVKPEKAATEKPAKPQKEKAAEKAPAAEKAAPASDAESTESRENRMDALQDSAVDYTTLGKDTPAYKACAYLHSILEKLGCTDVVLNTAPIHNGCFIDLKGTHLGIVIGRRGEALDALQYLTSLAANSKESGYFRVVLNIGNYREKRESTLQNLARRMASQCLRTGRSRTLEPMNPYERRIIHTVVQEIDGVTSSSIGEGASRRVVISPERGNRSFDKKAKKPEPVENRPVKKDAQDLPLYGKIN